MWDYKEELPHARRKAEILPCSDSVVTATLNQVTTCPWSVPTSEHQTTAIRLVSSVNIKWTTFQQPLPCPSNKPRSFTTQATHLCSAVPQKVLSTTQVRHLSTTLQTDHLLRKSEVRAIFIKILPAAVPITHLCRVDPLTTIVLWVQVDVLETHRTILLRRWTPIAVSSKLKKRTTTTKTKCDLIHQLNQPIL